MTKLNLESLKHIGVNAGTIDLLVQIVHDVTVTPDETENWQNFSIKEICEVSNGSSMNSENRLKFAKILSGIPYIATKDIGYHQEDIEYENGILIPSDEIGFRLSPANSILICMEGGSAGKKMAISNRDVYFGNKLISVTPSSKLLPEYLFSIFKSTQFQDLFKNSTQGLIGGISLKNFSEIAIRIPNLNEQEIRLKRRKLIIDQISVISKLIKSKGDSLSQILATLEEDFLSTEVTTELAASNFRILLGHLLQAATHVKDREQLKLTILEYVFNPKLDGLGTLANCPVLKLAEVGNWGAGSTPAKSNPSFYVGGKNIWIRSGELMDRQDLCDSEIKVTDLALKNCAFKFNKSGDVLLAITGATIGKVGILKADAVTNQHVLACSLNGKVSSKYLYWYLMSRRRTFTQHSVGGAQPGVSKGRLEQLEIPAPDIDTQNSIVEDIESIWAKLSTFFELVNQEQNLISEYCQSLLLGVRNVATVADINLVSLEKRVLTK